MWKGLQHPNPPRHTNRFGLIAPRDNHPGWTEIMESALNGYDRPASPALGSGRASQSDQLRFGKAIEFLLENAKVK